MDHHHSWYDYIPGYHGLLDYFQENFAQSVVFNGGIMPKVQVFETVHHIVAGLIVFVILGLLSLFAHFRLRDVKSLVIPSDRFNFLNVVELLMDALSGVMRDIIGPDYKRHLPLIGTFALFIMVSNLLGLIPGFVPPTDNLNTTLACGLVIFVYFNLQGLRVHGTKHITHLMNPIGIWWGWFLMPLLFPVEVISLMVRPMSLAIRLAGNMIGDHKVLLAFAGIMPFIFPLPFFALGLLVCVIQTVVFCLLSCVYIGLHTQEDAH